MLIQTDFRWKWLALSGVFLVASIFLFFYGVGLAGGQAFLSSLGVWASLGWVSFLEPFSVLWTRWDQGSAAAMLSGKVEVFLTWSWVTSVAFMLIGFGFLALGIKSRTKELSPSAAVGTALHPQLAQFRSFHGLTFLLYAAGILFSELVFVGAYTYWVSPVDGVSQGTSAQGLAPPTAFAAALGLSCLLGFFGGLVGTAHSKRISVPEWVIAVIYVGSPLPVFLMAVEQSPTLAVHYRERFSEVMYLASLLGRPEASYALIYLLFSFVLFLGMTAGFVATGSGRFDLRLRFELFVSARHVSVFRARFLLGVLLVLLLGIVPPILLFAILASAKSLADRARIRNLGRVDPLLAAEALDVRKRREWGPTALMTALSVLAVGVGVMALIIVLSVMSGFEEDLQNKILGTNAHGMALTYSGSMKDFEKALATVKSVRGVVGATPFIHGEVMVSSDGNIAGAMIKGIDPATVGDVTDLRHNVLPGGSLDALEKPETVKERLSPSEGAIKDDRPAVREEWKPSQTPETVEAQHSNVVLPTILVGKELAMQLRVGVGDRINVVSPLGGELGPTGPMPKSRPFRVGGIFYTGFLQYDAQFVYVHLREAQSFFKVDGASGLEMKVKDVDDARQVMTRVRDALGGYPYYTKDWGEMNRNLFAALRLEKLVMAIILSIIVIIAALLIVATVTMLVLEKRKEISVLKALGVPEAGIVKIFLSEGLQIGVAGGLLGLVAGLGWCVLIEKLGIKLDPEVYYIPSLPVNIEAGQTALSVLIAILVTFLASIYPALKASKVEPVDGLKAE